MAFSSAHSQWVRSQVNKIRSETSYRPMEELIENKPAATVATTTARPELTIDQYEAIASKRRIVPEHKIREPSSTPVTPHKRDSREMMDIEEMYNVSTKRNTKK